MEHALQDRLGGYLLSHRSRPGGLGLKTGWSVTISREAGAGGSSVARRLAEYLQEHQPSGGSSWSVFDQEIVGKVLEQHRLPKHLEEYMPEDAARLLPDTVEDLLGLHPAASELVQHLSETMMSLARRGHVILVGRGGNIITARLPNVLHVRLVASHAQRMKYVGELYNFSPKDAAKFIAKTDRARERFVRQSFGVRINDPVHYDLTVNTGRFHFDEAASLIGDVILRHISADAVRDEHGDVVRAWSLASKQ